MDTTTIIVILLIILLIGGGGFYGRGRWYLSVPYIGVDVSA